jgi:translocation protein SEC72
MDTFTQLPLTINSSTEVSSTHTLDPLYAKELAALNNLHKSLTSPQSEAKDGVAPPPSATQPKRSAQVTKLRDSGNTAHNNKKYADALKMYSLAIDMALARPAWEPAAIVREELSALYANRAQTYIALQQWAEGAVDGKTSVELRKNGNAKGWWRRGKCLVEMGRWEEARAWCEEGIEFEGQEKDLVELLEVARKGEKRAADGV